MRQGCLQQRGVILNTAYLPAFQWHEGEKMDLAKPPVSTFSSHADADGAVTASRR